MVDLARQQITQGKPNTMRYLAPVPQGLVSCQRQSATMMTLLPSSPLPLSYLFYYFSSFFPAPSHFIRFDSFDRELN